MAQKKIEICSRWDPTKVLYVAKGAADIKEALKEAVAKGANLRGADLWGADLREANLREADLREADLREADLWGANLREADLREADLREADLWGANLRGANLRGANLRGADLREADLRGAKSGPNPYAVNDLLILADQVGKVRAYKLVTAEGHGPFNGGITYEVGETYEVKDADCNPENQCGAGINLATLPWCIRNYSPGHRILLCEFAVKDIAAIPISDGKMRVKRCRIVRELNLADVGLAGLLDDLGVPNAS